MARSRNIKPGFFKNPELAELPYETRLLFAGLWTLADREGRLEDRPKKIKMEIFPADTLELEPELQRLHDKRFILRYDVAGKRYIQVLAFQKHQNPHHREPPSVIPEPEASPGPAHASRLVEPEASPGRGPSYAQGAPQASRADSGFLIPDSGDKPTVGLKPDESLPGETSKAKARREARAAGERAIAYLNAKAGTRFQATEANLRFPMGRILYDKASEQDLIAVVDLKLAESAKGEFDRKYLRPATLWNAEKFSQYSGQVGVPGVTAPAAKSHPIMVRLVTKESNLGQTLNTFTSTLAKEKVNALDLVIRTARNPALRREILNHRGDVVVELLVDDATEVLGRFSVREIEREVRAV